jgi:hypothetical protein
VIDDAFVIDAVAHGYNWTPENATDLRRQQQFVDQLYYLTADAVPKPWILDKEQWIDGADPELVAGALFAESPTDFAVYHHVPIFGMFKDGGSPLWVGERMRERWPGRVAIYGGVSPWQPDALEQVDRLVEEHKVIGLKLYPLDIVDGEIKTIELGDQDVVFPLLERAQQLGIRSVAIHKAIPLGAVPIEPFAVRDVEDAAAAFPDLYFEIVHGGVAFVEETAWQIARFPNVVINLEGTAGSLLRAPAVFAQVLGTFLRFGGEDRIVWATGCMAMHPKGLLDAFASFQMPPELALGFGLPEITPEIKRKVLGENFARIHGLGIDELKRQTEGDEFSQRGDFDEPWSRAPERWRAAA